MRHILPTRVLVLATGTAGWLLSGCQAIHDAQLNLPPDIAPMAQRCDIQTESQWGGNTFRACGHALKTVGGTMTTTSGSQWDMALAGARSTEKRTRFRYQFTAQGEAPQEWQCERLELDRERHVARVLWKSSYEGSLTCHAPGPEGEERFTFDTRYPDRITWFKGESAQVWRFAPQQHWQGGGQVMAAPAPMGWCAYDEQGAPLGCHDWVAKGGAVWQVPQASAASLRRLTMLALAPQQLWSSS